MGDYEQADPEQQLNIATYFIMSSPTGEVDAVVEDVKKLVGSQVLSSGTLKKIMKDYNVEQLHPSKDPDGNKVLVSAHGQVGDDLFLDPTSGRVLQFDHVARKYTSVTEKKQVLSGSIKDFRDAIDEAIKTYTSKNFKSRKGEPKYGFGVYGVDSGVVTIAIACENINLGNFWTGGWRSVYQIDTSKSGSQDMKSDIKLNVHYFEDGNVQLHTKFPSSAKVTIGDAKATADSVVKAIYALETQFQENLEEMYIEMNRKTFAQMRRFWPVHKQPFNWNSNAHKMTAQMGGS